MIDDTRFFAWLDGELAPAEAAEVEALVAGDRQLAQKAAEHCALHGRLHAAFDPIIGSPVPLQLRQAAHARPAGVVSIEDRRRSLRVFRPTQWMAMAATLAIGVVAGSLIDSGASAPLVREDGQLIAAGELEAALYTRLASAPADSGPRIGLTFRNRAGDLCRSFTDSGTSGLACHQSGDWRIRGLFQAGEGQRSEFRMASGHDPRLAELVDSAMAGEPFDADAERQALATLE